jgi:hypothetical protein
LDLEDSPFFSVAEVAGLNKQPGGAANASLALEEEI